MDTKKRRPSDINVLGKSIVDQATQENKPALTSPLEPSKEKNPAAVSLGRLGGLKGGPARAKKLSSKKRKEIAKLAAISRWSSKK